MVQKILILFLFFFILTLNACYTITHPDPCPGLVEEYYDDKQEVVVEMPFN
tara:strand:- start:789 stop:941 length:153 start_codon:yes stop_codon:yes gene_type:complete